MRGVVNGEADDKWVFGKGAVPGKKQQRMGGWIFVKYKFEGRWLSWFYLGDYPLHILQSKNLLVFFVRFVDLHLGSILVNNQLDAQFFFSYIFIPVFYMFRAPLSSSTRESIALIRCLVYVTLCRWPSRAQVCSCTLDGHLHRFTYTRLRSNTIDSPDDEHRGARSM
jgi:hypothetical protein